MNPEVYSYVIPKLFEEGALDVYLTNIIMKKNRPGIKISILCEDNDTESFENILFAETSTLGIRKYKVDREKLERQFIKVKTKYGIITVKQAIRNGKVLKSAPEYEDCKKIAEENNIPINKVYTEVAKSFN
nr:nickel insertion protein [Sporosalibacterium faouarense]